MYRILIVDRERACREITGLLTWEQFGFEPPATAYDFSDGLDMARQYMPQVVLVAARLGEWRGEEFVLRLKAMGLSCVCALLDSHPDMDHVRRAMRAGCRDFLKAMPDSHSLKEFLEWVLAEELRAPLPGLRGGGEWDPVLEAEYASFSKITSRVLQAVRTDFRQSLSLTAIAASWHMSSKYMGRVFLRETGMRFTEYLMAYRMLEAKRLILGTGEKISVIAGMVGYSQLNNFYTHFRQYFGMSPSSLRMPTEEVTPNEKPV